MTAIFFFNFQTNVAPGGMFESKKKKLNNKPSMRIAYRIFLIHLLFAFGLLVALSRLSQSVNPERVPGQQPPDQPSSSCKDKDITNICAVCLEQVTDECSIEETVSRCNHEECHRVLDASSACNHRFCRGCVNSIKEFNREFRPLHCPVCRRPKGCRTPTRGPLPSNPVELQNMERALRQEVSQALNRRRTEIIVTAREHMNRFGGQPNDSDDEQQLARDVESFTSRFTAAGANYVERIQALQELLAKIDI